MMDRWVSDALDAARVARLGTVDAAGEMRLVPMCFAVVDGWIVSAVDHKPKRTARLRRLDDLIATATATVLFDHYDDDWSRLWWVRVRGRAVVHEPSAPEAAAAVGALVTKYVQYRERPPAGAVYQIAIDEVRSWRATPGPAR
jgi:PPOX class probable F420-dependent enzyme